MPGLTDIQARIGRTNVEVTRLGFGAAAMAGLYQAVPEDRARASVTAAYEGGVRYFDTAPHYGFGLSETRLGAALGKLDPDERTVVSTKVGRLLVPIDADLQNDPADIHRLIDKLHEGYDVVSGWRKTRKDPFVFRQLPSICANYLISRITYVHLHDYGCTLKAYRREIMSYVSMYGEMHRFLPAICKWRGARIAEEVVNHRPRVSGHTKYGIDRTMRVLLDLLTVKFLISYSTRPLQIFGLFGMILGALGALICAWLAYVKYFQHEGIADRPLLLLGILLVSTGVQLLTLGLLAEMLARTYHESQDKPTYVIREIRETLGARPREAVGA